MGSVLHLVLNCGMDALYSFVCGRCSRKSVSAVVVLTVFLGVSVEPFAINVSRKCRESEAAVLRKIHTALQGRKEKEAGLFLACQTTSIFF